VVVIIGSAVPLYAGAVAVRALVFDVFGTLVDWRSGVAKAFRASGLADEPQELADEWRARLWPILAEVNSGARPWSNFDELQLVTLEDLLAQRGLVLPVDARSRLVRSWHVLDPWPDVQAGLSALRRQRVTASLSNAQVALLVDLARHGDLRLDCLLSAELAHVYKPAPEVYLTAARLLGVHPAEVMLVAAHPLDLQAARRAGLRTAFVDRPLEYGPGSTVRTDPDADESVSDLHDLAARLGS
jgi:2-haloacid dehalogenase